MLESARRHLRPEYCSRSSQSVSSQEFLISFTVALTMYRLHNSLKAIVTVHLTCARNSSYMNTKQKTTRCCCVCSANSLSSQTQLECSIAHLIFALATLVAYRLARMAHISLTKRLLFTCTQGLRLRHQIFKCFEMTNLAPHIHLSRRVSS